MEQTAEVFMPILFKVLFAFIIINMLVNLILLLTKQQRMYKLLAIYWPILLVNFLMQSIFQVGTLPVTLAYATTFFTSSILAIVGFEALGKKFPYRNYIIYYLCTLPITLILNSLGYDFTTVAMPFAVATGTPVLHAFYLMNIKYRHQSSRLQKVLGLIFLIQFIHCINFALFRMDPGAQLWGWLVAYAIYDTLGILLPSIALEQANLSENARLTKLVEERTKELEVVNEKLNATLEDNENLLKIVIHDIANPLQLTQFCLPSLTAHTEKEQIALERITKSQNFIQRILEQVHNLYVLKSNLAQMELKPVEIEDCFQEVSTLFASTSEQKNISLNFVNKLSPSSKVLADKTSLTHSVLSNLVSNGLKYSSPNTSIDIIAKEENNKVVLEVKDQGPGMTDETIKNILHKKKHKSSVGTFGEKGSGFGMSIVMSVIDSYGGKLEIDSHLLAQKSLQSGTNIKITLDRA